MKNISVPNLKKSSSIRAWVTLLGVATLTGCAPMPPLPFELVGSGQVFHGTLLQSDRRIEADIAGKHFQGYYLLITGTSSFQAGGWRRAYSYDMRTDFVSNSGRASMVAPDGEWLTCEFIMEDDNAIGECKSTNQQTYQLVTRIR